MNEVNGRDSDNNEVTQSISSGKQVERSSSGGFFSCFRGSKVADASKDVYETAVNDGNVNSFFFQKNSIYASIVVFNQTYRFRDLKLSLLKCLKFIFRSGDKGRETSRKR